MVKQALIGNEAMAEKIYIWPGFETKFVLQTMCSLQLTSLAHIDVQF